MSDSIIRHDKHDDLSVADDLAECVPFPPYENTINANSPSSRQEKGGKIIFNALI
jgi:hypothetical protein